MVLEAHAAQVLTLYLLDHVHFWGRIVLLGRPEQLASGKALWGLKAGEL
jgi:hypothetical protein